MSDEIRKLRLEDVRLGWTGDYWWPAYDTNAQGTFKYLMARVTDVDITVKLCGKRRHTVIQAGGHAGLYPLRLAESFKHVISFEPDPPCFEALRRNVHGRKNIEVHQKALGAVPGTGFLEIKARPGGASMVDVRPDAAKMVGVDIITIDSLGLKNVDAMVIDVEHGECEVIRGALETIERCNPVLHVEELERRKAELQALIKGLGYRERRRVHGDAIYTRER